MKEDTEDAKKNLHEKGQNRLMHTDNGMLFKLNFVRGTLPFGIQVKCKCAQPCFLPVSSFLRAHVQKDSASCDQNTTTIA